MIRIIILILGFLIISVQVFGQWNLCDTLTFKDNQTLFDAEGITVTEDYIRTYFPHQRRYISNRHELEALNLWLNSDSIMLFKDEFNEVRISFSTIEIDPMDVFYPKAEGESFSIIREYGDGLPFGIISEDSIVSNIIKISVNDKEIPESSFSDLMNPNKYKTILSVKPIEVFKSECRQYLYLYIFGRPNPDIMTMNESMNFSYMAKLIITKKGYYVDRIVVPGEILNYFGFGECPYFIGF